MNHTLNQDTSAVLKKEPEWLQDRRQSGIEAYQSLPTPSAKDENWRFSAALTEAIESFIPSSVSQLSEESSTEIRTQSKLVDEPIAELIFADDHLISARSLPDDLIKSGVCYMPISEQSKSDQIYSNLLPQRIDPLGLRKVFWTACIQCQSGLFTLRSQRSGN